MTSLRCLLMVAWGIAILLPGNVTPGEDSVDNSADLQREDASRAEVTFEQLKYAPGDSFRRMFMPEHISDLDCKRVRLRGYMWPSFKQRGIARFVMLPSAGRSGWHYRADEAIRVSLKTGYGTEFTTRPVVVEGTFSIDPVRGDDKVISLYHLRNARVFAATGEGMTGPLKAQAGEVAPSDAATSTE